MSGQHRWTIGIATGTGILGLTVTSGLAMLAHRFLEEFSRPHRMLDSSAFTWMVPQVSYEPATSYQRALLFETSDGTLLCGDFWAQPQPAPTVILCHGYRVSRSHLRSVAALEHSHGYNVLFFDFRGHGDSDSVMTSGGNAEVKDLEAALEVARQQPETIPGRIILHGFSMGASVALLTPPHPEVVAIIADSPYARSDDILRRFVQYQLANESGKWFPPLQQIRRFLPALAWTTVAVSALVFRLRFGYNVVARPDASFKRWQVRTKAAKTTVEPKERPIPILLIHSAGDELIPIEHARQIAAEAEMYNVPLETYFVDGVTHCGAYGYDPLQYTRVLQEFLSRHLKDDFPTQHNKIDINDR